MKHNFSLQIIKNQLKFRPDIKIIRTYSTIQQQPHVEEQYQTDKFDRQLLREADNFIIKQQSNKNVWTYEQQIRLFKLHDQLGNRWGIIAQQIENQTDNSIKNHFYSKLRKSLRKLNKIVNIRFKKQMKQIKKIVLYKIIQATQQKHKPNSCHIPQISDLSTELKNRLLFYSYDQNQLNNYQKNPNYAHQLIHDLVNFSKQYKRKSKNGKKVSSGDDQQKNFLSPNILAKTKSNKRSNSQYGESQEGTPSDCSIFGSQISQTNSDNNLKLKKSEKVILTRRRAKSKQQTQIKRMLEESQNKQINKFGSNSMELQFKVQKNEDLQNLLKQSGIFQDQYFAPLPQMMKKQYQYCQNIQIQNIIQERQQNFQFCNYFQLIQVQQSQMQMRILPAKSQDHFNDPMLNQRNFDFFK